LWAKTGKDQLKRSTKAIYPKKKELKWLRERLRLLENAENKKILRIKLNLRLIHAK
jgi:hypothetical protein